MTHTERGIHDARQYGPTWPDTRHRNDDGSSPAYGMAIGMLGVVLVVVLLIALTLAN